MTLTLVYDDEQELDVTVSAPTGSVLGDVREQLAAAVGMPGAVLYAGSTPLGDDVPLGSPGLRHGCLLGVGTVGPRRGDAGAVLELRVVSGLLAGQAFRLGRGEHVIGRGSTCSVRIDDPVSSRRHAVVRVAADGVTVADLGSTNGTRLDGDSVRDKVPLAPGQLLRVGDSVLCLAVPADIPAETRTTRGGTVAVNRPPRLADAPAEVTIDWPSRPQPRTTPRLALIALVLPVLAGVGLAVVLRMPQFLLFTLLSPLIMLGNYLSDRTGRRRGRRRDLADYDRALRHAETDLGQAVALDSATRRRTCPDLAAVRATAQRPGQRLWERRPSDADFALLRLGTAVQPGGVSVRADGRREPVEAADLPVTVALAGVGVLGLAGPDEPLLALARGLICQLATLHSPRDLRIVLLTSGHRAAQWAWARWLPQLHRAETVAGLTAVLDVRQRERRGGAPDTVLVLHEAGRLRAGAGVTRLLTEGPAAGILAVCLDRHVRRLPAECRAVAAVTGDVGTRLRVSTDGGPCNADVLADGLPLPVALDLARALAALRDPGDGAAQHVPGQVRLLDLLGLQQPSGALLAAAWATSDRTPRAVLGRTAKGTYAVDLVRDGPHTLVAGTTGAGKSELLQTLIAALAATMPPTAIQFVLVDYKGGAAFRDLADLPHTVGLVTDLDAHLTRRALRSLAAELNRRERMLAAAGASDLADYSGTAPVPRLLIVVDEFAALAKELPDFVSGLVAIAARGRSLGIHLVLATQRPGGAVTPEIRANTSLRIALRVTDEGESRDIVDQAGAAGISKHTPGRALIRAGTEPATLVQTARVAGHPPGPPPAPTVVAAWQSAPHPVSEDGEGPTDLQRLVEAARDAARLTGRHPAPSPWLPALPDLLQRDELADVPGMAVLGLIDHPDEQRRSVLGLDLAADAALLIAGGQRSGRTTAARTLLASLARGWSADDVHVHVIDCAGGGLLAAQRLPQCGCAVGRDDTARGRRLLLRLLEETERRQALLAGTGAASLTEYRSQVAPHDKPPYVVLVLDGWEGFVQSYEPVDGGQPVETLLRLIREGAAAGIRVVVTSDRSGLGVRLSGLIARRVVLPLADRGDYGLAGIPARAVPGHLPPGRGLLPDSGLECQIAVVSEDPSGAAQTAALDAVATDTPAATMHPPLRITELPGAVALDRLPRPDRPMWTVLGRGGDDAEPILLDLEALGPGLLVAGPARSGKSTALLVLAHGLLRAGTPIAVVTGRRSALRTLAGVHVVGPADSEALRAATTRQPAVVLADDIELLLDTPVDSVLAGLVRADAGVTVVGAGRSEDLAGAFRGLGVDLRRRRTGLLLTPGPLDGELLGVRLPRGLAERAPGRGYLVEHGTLTRVQVALPPQLSPGAGTPR